MESNSKIRDLSQSDLILYLHAASAFQILHAGVELKLFELVHNKKSLSLFKITELLKLKKQPARCLVFGLTSLGLITKSKELYQNSRAIEELFSKKEWDLFRKMVLIQAHIMYLGQIDLVESLKQNTNVGLQRYYGTGKTIYDKLDQNAKLKKIFYDFIEAYSDYANPYLVRNVDFSKDKYVLDIGGGVGSNAIAIAKHNPHLIITLLELPLARAIAKEKIRKNNLTDKIKFCASDMFKDDFPKNQDSILFIHQLVIWSLEENSLLLSKAHKALNKNGRVIIFSSISEDSEDGPLMAALDTVYFRAVAAGKGMIYPWKDYEKLLLEIGFKKIEHIRCDTWTPHGIIIGYK